MTALFTAIILVLGEAVRIAGRALADSGSTATLVLVMGGIGLAAMATAVFVGVWSSVRTSIGARRTGQPFVHLVGCKPPGIPRRHDKPLTFAVYFIQGRLGVPGNKAAGPASILMMVVGVLILFSALPSGWLADRFGRKPLVILAGILATLGTAIAVSVPAMPAIYVGGCFIGLGTGLFFTVNWALGTEIVPKAEAGRYLGISNLAGAGAGAVGAYIGGPIAGLLHPECARDPRSGLCRHLRHLWRALPVVSRRPCRRP